MALRKYNHLASVDAKASLLIFLAGIFMTILFNVTSDFQVLYIFAVLVAVAVLVSTWFLPKHLLLYPVFVLILCMPDLTQSFEEIEQLGHKVAASPWQFAVGPITPAVFVFSSLLVVLFRLFDIPKKIPFKAEFIYFFIVVAAVSLMFGFPQDSIPRTIADAKIPMFFCVGLWLFLSYYRRYPENLAVTCQVFLLLAAGNFFIDFYKFLFVKKEAVAGVSYSSLSLDSAKGLLMIFTFYALAHILQKRQLLVSIAVLLITVLMLIAYQTRWLIVTLVLGLLLVGFFTGVRKMVVLGAFSLLLIAISIPLMMRFAPETLEIMMIRFSFVENLKPGASLEDVEVARAGAIYNSTNLVLERKAFLTGMGYGSWYTDSYFPMPNLTLGAFDEESLQSGKYYRVHDFIFNFFFKFGLIGLFIYSASFFRPVRKLWRLHRHFRGDFQYNRVAITLIGVFPMVLSYLWFTGKGLLFSAFFIIITYYWVRAFSQPKALHLNARTPPTNS